MSQFKRFLVCADNHGDLVCLDAKKKLLDFAKTWKPHYRIHLGDVFDFSCLRMGASQEDKSDGIGNDFTDGIAFLDEFKPGFLTLGNHDDRIYMQAQQRADGILRERCEELCKSLERELAKRKIKWVPYHINKYLQLPEGGPKLIHGFKSSLYPAKAHFDNWGPSICGHVHKPDYHAARHISGGESFSVGCMADLSKFTYSNRQPARLGHRTGFLYGIINSKGKWTAWNISKDEDGDWISPHGQL
jgi:hypothetical protein